MSGWSDERVDFLKKVWATGVSASLAAEQINSKFHTRFSRNAIIGKVHREGLALRGARNPKGRLRASKKRNPARVVLRTTLTKINQNAYAREKREFTADNELLSIEARAAADIARVTFANLEDNHCRYVIGDPRTPEHGYCGQDKVPGLPYCEHHARRCFQPPKVTARPPETYTATPLMTSKILMEDA
ncbi:MAG: GcrA family cell cycle regulator [Hyphomicrobiaceae bacterium]|nr:GcrA family cell cycle regulator [Hyphomicrobiaceae bacterium]